MFNELDPLIEKMVESDCINESQMDIGPIHLWRGRLGKNARNTADHLVLTIRGDLLKRYPDAIIYAVDGYKPGLSEDDVANILNENPAIYPVFGAQVLPDVTFLGFPFNESEARGTGDRPGKFFVIEEHVGLPRFGLDIGPENGNPIPLGESVNWNNLSWGHFDLMFGDYINSVKTKDKTRNLTQDEWKEWLNSSSAKRALITLQKPVRIMISADELLPK